MYKHPLVYLFTKRIDRLLFIPFTFTLVLFLLSFFHHAYPGHSAQLIAEAARLTPSIQPAHGLFSTITHALASCNFLSLSTRLNFFAALCGCLSATLFYRLLARAIIFYAYEPHEYDASLFPEDETAAKPSFETVFECVGVYNQRLLSIAIKSSLAATMLLSLMAPFWLASTHLNESIFNLAWMLVIFTIFPAQESPLSPLRFLLAMTFFTMGLYESGVFVILFPVMVSMTFTFYLQNERRAHIVAYTLFGGFAGFIIAFCFRPPTPEAFSGTFLLNLERFLKSIVYHHIDEFKLLFFTKGWLVSLLQTAIPATILLFGKSLVFDKWTVNTRMASIIIIAIAIPGAMVLSISPFSIFQEVDHLPVFAAAVLAAALAFVFAASRLFFVSKSNAPIPSEELSPLEEQPPQPSDKPAVAFIILLVFVTLITPFRSIQFVKASKSQFADIVAREMVVTMSDRTWMITNGHIDNQLRIQAHILNKPLHLVTLRQRETPDDRRALVNMIETDQAFENMNRPRLLNALSIGTLRFVMEWLVADTNMCHKAMVLGTPDLWTACKYRALPQGLSFSGLPADATFDVQPLIDSSMVLANRMAPLLISQKETACPILLKLSALLRLKMGFAVNELGVLLEDMNKPDEAFAAYQRANQIDPENVSALLNAYSIAKGGKAKVSQTEQLRQRLRKRLNELSHSRLGMQGLFLNYGTIHQKAFYKQEAENWIARGAQVLALEKVKKVLDLSDQTGVNALLERAYYYSMSSQPSQAEACYLAALEQDPSNFEALYGITILMINTKDIPKAEMWLARATSSKDVKPGMFLYPTILIAIHNNDKAGAEKLLENATKTYPEDERFWKLRALFLLNKGDAQGVRHSVLPEMAKALKDPEHYLIHIVRGLMLKQQGPAYYREARISLLKGLSMNASMTEMWNTVLELDMLIGNLELMEGDIQHLLILQPDHAQANYMKGSIQLARGKIQSAEDFMRRSIEKMPTAVACNDLAEILRRQKKLKEAKAFAHQAIELDPKLKNARATLGAILTDTEKEVASPPPAKQE